MSADSPESRSRKRFPLVELLPLLGCCTFPGLVVIFGVLVLVSAGTWAWAWEQVVLLVLAIVYAIPGFVGLARYLRTTPEVLHEVVDARRQKKAIGALELEAIRAQEAGQVVLAKEILTEALRFARTAGTRADVARVKKNLRHFRVQQKTTQLRLQAQEDWTSDEIAERIAAAEVQRGSGRWRETREELTLALTLAKELGAEAVVARLRPVLAEITGREEKIRRDRETLATRVEAVRRALAEGREIDALETYAEAEVLSATLEDSQPLDPVRESIESLHQRRERAITRARVTRRKRLLDRALAQHGEISIARLARLLDLEDSLALEKWLLTLPDDTALRIQGNKVVLVEGADLTGAISAMLRAYTEWEARDVGKRG